jgi:hypothetical protein
MGDVRSKTTSGESGAWVMGDVRSKTTSGESGAGVDALGGGGG